MEVYTMATLTTQIKVRRDTYEAIKNVVLAQGEPGFAYDTGAYAVGDGSSKFSAICFKLKDGVINTGTSTDNAVARFDGTTGQIIQNSGIIVDDNNNLTTKGLIKIQNGSASGAFVLGADVNAITLTANQRKLGRMGVPSYDSNGTKTVAGISFDSQPAANYADFGGHPNNAASIAPDVIRFIVANSHDNAANGARTLALQISKQDGLVDTAGGGTSVAAAKFFIPVQATSSITSNEGFIHGGLTAATGKTKNDYILLAGGSTKPISDFATGGSIKVKANDVLAITTDNELSTKYTNTATTTVDVGGLSKGTSVDGWSLKQIIDKLLYKYQAPSVGGLTINGSQNNDYIGGTVTISKATISVSAGSTTPSMKSSSLSWNGATYTGNNAGSAFTAFSSKTITFTINKTWTSTASDTTFEQLTGTATINLTGGKENGTDWSTTKTGKNSVYYFDRSEYYWGGSASATDTSYNKDNKSNNTQRNKLGSGTGTALTAVLSNQVFTLVLPKKWGTTLKVYDGASNPVTGVFKNVGEVHITNKNNYNETYIVWKGAAATGTIKYFFQVS